MAFLEETDVHQLYTDSTKEADIWREDYPEYERLADNGLLEDEDDDLPEVNDGSLCAALFKLPKRVVSTNLTGHARALDRSDAWLTELANLHIEKKIIPNANSMAPWHRKWKDAVRKAAIYGGQPIVTMFMDRGDYSGTDILIPPAQDVKLEAGKVSDYDSDVIFWDLYYSKQQVQSMLEEATDETDELADDKAAWLKRKQEAEAAGDKDFEEDEPEPYNTWYPDVLKKLLEKEPTDERSGNEETKALQDKGITRQGYHFYIAFQRGVNAPFMMFYGKDCVRKWSNPDPTGDLPVHYVYCYQDFVNPYGTGIVKLAGGTQNVLDYMRKADVLATQLGLRPPKLIHGDDTDTDYDSLTYTEDADWVAGDADITRMEIADGVYTQLPNRVNMYKTSLNQILPMGDTSISATAGDPNASKTPAGVKMAQANLSIDDEDFKDNLYLTYAAVMKSVVNTEFANMMGKDTYKVTDEEREILEKAGITFPTDLLGRPSNELLVEWDLARGTFDYEVDPENDKSKDDATKLEGLKTAADFLANPNTQTLLAQPVITVGNKRINVGELVAEIVALSTDNDKIVTDITPEEQEAEAQAAPAGQPGQPEQPAPGLTPEEIQLKQRDLDIKQQGADAKMMELRLKGQDQAHRQAIAEHDHALKAGQQQHQQSQDRRAAQLPDAKGKPAAKNAAPAQLPADPAEAEAQQHQVNVQAVMEQYNLDEKTADAMVTMEEEGVDPKDILAGLQRHQQGLNEGGAA